MGLAETAKLVVDLSLKGNFASQIKSSERTLAGFDRSITNTQGRAYKAGQQIGTGIKAGAIIAAGAIGFLAANVLEGVRSLSNLDDVVTQTNAVLKSTKGVAGESAAAIRDLATKYEALNATIDDTVIQSGENLLLTFTAIRKDAFEPALRASLDLSQALHQDLQTSVLQVGKALQDPVRGITALRRAGVNFSKDQIALIKHLDETGQSAKAQQVILAELTKEFGGSFAAAGQTATGKVAGFKDAIDDLQRLLATAMLPVIGKVADALKKFLGQDSVKKGVTDLGLAIASLFSDANLARGADFLKGAFETAKEAAPIVAASAKATFGLVQSAVGLFKSLPPEIQKLAVAGFAVNKLTGGLVTNIAGGIIDAVGKQFLQRGGTPANPLFVSDISGGLGKGGVGAAVGSSKLGKIASAASKVFLIGAAVGVFAELKGILDEQTTRNKTQATALTGQTDAFVKIAGIDDMRASLKGIDDSVAAGIRNDFGFAAAYNLNIDGVRDAVNQQRDTLQSAISKEQSALVAAGERNEAIASRKSAEDARRVGSAVAIGARRTEAAENRAANAARLAGVVARSGGLAAARAITIAQARIAAASRAAGQAAAFAIRDKDLSVTNNITVPVRVTVSARETIKTQTTFKQYFRTAS